MDFQGGYGRLLGWQRRRRRWASIDKSSTSAPGVPNAWNATLRVDHVNIAVPVTSGSPTESEHSSSVQAKKFKQFYSGEKFQPNYFTLGSHARVLSPVAPGIAFVHYHSRSFEDNVRVATQTLLGHGYVKATDSKEEMIEKFKKLDEWPSCRRNSCFKIPIVLDALTKFEETQQNFLENSKAWPTNLVVFREHLRKIFAKYPSIVID